ncbi:MAG: NAD-dependent epimerase/dehydratase family protein [Acutalibacteraceae bacterium]
MNNGLSVVTGASGHVGYALVRELEDRGANYRILIRSDSKIFDGLNCEKAYGDVTDPASLEKAFEGADVVYHLAGLIDVGNGRQEALRKVNVEGTKNVVAACKKCGVSRLVFVSSVDAMKPLSCNSLITEPFKYDPDSVESAYGKTKAEASQFVLDSAEENFKTTIILPSACIGPYDFKISTAGQMVRMIMRGLMPVSLNFGGYNFVDVRDVAKGIVAAAERGKSGESYLITGEVISADQIINLVARLSGRKAPLIKMPYSLTMVLAPLAELYYKISGANPVFTRTSVRILTHNCNFSNKRQKKNWVIHP